MYTFLDNMFSSSASAGPKSADVVLGLSHLRIFCLFVSEIVRHGGYVNLLPLS